MTHEQRVLEISCEIFRFYQFLALKCKGNFLRSEISSMSNVAVSGAFPRNKLFSFRTLGPWDMFIIPSFHPWQGSHWKLLQTRHCRHLDPVGCVSPGWQRLGKQGWPGPLEACNLVFLASCMMEKMVPPKMGTTWRSCRWVIVVVHIHIPAEWLNFIKKLGGDGNFPESTQQVRFWDKGSHPQILKPMTWGEREVFEQNPVTNLLMYFSRWNCNI